MKNRYAFIFEIMSTGDWFMYCLEPNGYMKGHFCSYEDDYDKSRAFVELFLENGGDLYWYNVPNPYIFKDAVEDDTNLKNEPIEGLHPYRTKKHLRI